MSWDEAAFRERMLIEADLQMWLCDQVWNHFGSFSLGGEDCEGVGCDEVPGYEDRDYSVLLRRESDGRIFEADIEVSVSPVLTPQQEETRALELSGQMRLPLEVAS